MIHGPHPRVLGEERLKVGAVLRDRLSAVEAKSRAELGDEVRRDPLVVREERDLELRGGRGEGHPLLLELRHAPVDHRRLELEARNDAPRERALGQLAEAPLARDGRLLGRRFVGDGGDVVVRADDERLRPDDLGEMLHRELRAFGGEAGVAVQHRERVTLAVGEQDAARELAREVRDREIDRAPDAVRVVARHPRPVVLTDREREDRADHDGVRITGERGLQAALRRLPDLARTSLDLADRQLAAVVLRAELRRDAAGAAVGGHDLRIRHAGDHAEAALARPVSQRGARLAVPVRRALRRLGRVEQQRAARAEEREGRSVEGATEHHQKPITIEAPRPWTRTWGASGCGRERRVK